MNMSIDSFGKFQSNFARPLADLDFFESRVETPNDPFIIAYILHELLCPSIKNQKQCLWDEEELAYFDSWVYPEHSLWLKIADEVSAQKISPQKIDAAASVIVSHLRQISDLFDL